MVKNEGTGGQRHRIDRQELADTDQLRNDILIPDYVTQAQSRNSIRAWSSTTSPPGSKTWRSAEQRCYDPGRSQ